MFHFLTLFKYENFYRLFSVHIFQFARYSNSSILFVGFSQITLIYFHTLNFVSSNHFKTRNNIASYVFTGFFFKYFGCQWFLND